MTHGMTINKHPSFRRDIVTSAITSNLLDTIKPGYIMLSFVSL